MYFSFEMKRKKIKHILFPQVVFTKKNSYDTSINSTIQFDKTVLTFIDNYNVKKIVFAEVFDSLSTYAKLS